MHASAEFCATMQWALSILNSLGDTVKGKSNE